MQQQGMEQVLIDDTNKMVSIDLILTALGKEAFFSFRPMSQFPTTTIVTYYICSILVMAFLYAGLYIGFQVLTEMKQGTFARLQTTQTPLYRFLTAKVLLMVILLTISSAIAVVVLKGDAINGTVILFCLSLSMFCVCFAVFLSAFFRTTQRFILVGNLCIFYFIVLGGGIIPIQFLPQDMLALSKMTPNYYMMKGMIHLTTGQPYKVNQIIMGFILLSIFLFGIAVLLFMKRSVNYDEV
jgi:ABC-2 type transport system permease protein